MKTSTKKLIMFMLCLIFVLSMGATVFAAGFDPGTTINGMQNGTANTTKIQSIGANVLQIIRVVGIIIGVIVLAVLGLKYMAGSLEEKAEYKKTMIPWVIGAVLLIAAPTIALGIFNLVQDMA